jgi:hypothetical protein
MLTDTAINHFGRKFRIAQLLKPDWTISAVYMWEDVVPHAAAQKLAQLSEGKLEVIESLYDSHGNIIRTEAEKRAAARKRKKRKKRA